MFSCGAHFRALWVFKICRNCCLVWLVSVNEFCMFFISRFALYYSAVVLLACLQVMTGKVRKLSIPPLVFALCLPISVLSKFQGSLSPELSAFDGYSLPFVHSGTEVMLYYFLLLVVRALITLLPP